MFIFVTNGCKDSNIESKSGGFFQIPGNNLPTRDLKKSCLNILLTIGKYTCDDGELEIFSTTSLVLYSSEERKCSKISLTIIFNSKVIIPLNKDSSYGSP